MPQAAVELAAALPVQIMVVLAVQAVVRHLLMVLAVL
jgi:hypothetical protein